MRFHFDNIVWRITRHSLLFFSLVPLLLGNVSAAAADASESAYFGDLPVVLSVTRLAQSLADTPGSVTIIDREMIRKSGVRDVVELLRFVPGFIVGRMDNGAHPSASYHASLDTLYGGRHMQVFVDGRSVYSSIYIGDTHFGLMGVVLEDVERIEVLRGSNSAAYGANAFLGVINIITRSSMDTHGGLVSVTSGNRGINDQVVRVGGGNTDASFRLTASRRNDHGGESFRDGPFNRAIDDRAIQQFHFRSDMRLNSDNDLLFQVGSTDNVSGTGTGDLLDGNPLRNETTTSKYAQLRWSHDISAKESLMVTAQLDQEDHEDNILLPWSNGGVTGTSHRQNFEIQHTRQYSDSIRAVLGAALRHEMVRGLYLFENEAEYTQNQKRVFGNVEWHAASDWVVNAGGLYEYNSVNGGGLSPRLMLNHHLTPEHTLRIGATRATRTPTIVELQGRLSIFNPATGLPILPIILGNDALKEESVRSKEIGYLGSFPRWNLNVDARMFWEDIRNIVDLPETSPGSNLYIFANSHNMQTEGLEQQWRWRPWDGTQFLFNHTYTRIRSNDSTNELRAPRVSHSGTWFQQLPGGVDLSLMYSHVQEMSFGDASQGLPQYTQVDVRLAYPFRIGATKAEAALTSQAINGSHLENVGNILFTQRTYATLRLEF